MNTEDIVKDLLDATPAKTAALLGDERLDRIMRLASGINMTMPFVLKGNVQDHLTVAEAVQEVGTAYAIVIAQFAALNPKPGQTPLDALIDLTVCMSQGIQAGGQFQGVCSSDLFAEHERRRQAIQGDQA